MFTTIFLTAAALAVSVTANTPLSLLSFNIRYATTNLQPNEQPWPIREPLVVAKLAEVASNAAAAGAIPIFGLQEVLYQPQLTDILAGLGPEWTYYGVGRDDGKMAGEYNPILYQPALLKVVFNETKWLSPTPDDPTYGWCAGSKRIVTIVVFEVIATNARFIATNTHLDNESCLARIKGVGVILKEIADVQVTYGPLGVYLTGDFNSQPDGDAYKAMVESGYLDDAYELATPGQRFGPFETFTGFSMPPKNEIKIDYVWVGPAAEKLWNVTRYEVQSNVDKGIYMSDHRAVVADVILLQD